MRLDGSLKLADALALTVSALATTVLDFGAKVNPGLGGARAAIEITVDQTFTADGAATVQFALQGGAEDNLSDAVDVLLTPAIAKADMVAGRDPIRIPIPADWDYDHMGVYATVATGPFTAGKYTARLVTDESFIKSYPNAAGANFT